MEKLKAPIPGKNARGQNYYIVFISMNLFLLQLTYKRINNSASKHYEFTKSLLVCIE